MYQPAILSLLLGAASAAKYGGYTTTTEAPAYSTPSYPKFSHYSNATIPYSTPAAYYSSAAVYYPPTPSVDTCSSAGTYTFPASTYIATETTTVCAPSSTYLTKGVNVYGGYTTSVSGETTITAVYGAVETYGTETSSIVTSTIYTCPYEGEYTIAATTTTVSTETVYWYPVPTVYVPGTYVQPAATVSATAGEIVYRPYQTASASVYEGEFVVGLGISGSYTHKTSGFNTYVGFAGKHGVVVGSYEEAAVFYFKGSYLMCGEYYVGVSTYKGYTMFEKYETAPKYSDIYIVNGALKFHSYKFTYGEESMAQFCGTEQGYLMVKTTRSTPFACVDVFFYGEGYGSNEGTCGYWSSSGSYSAPVYPPASYSSEAVYSTPAAVYYPASTFSTSYAAAPYSTPVYGTAYSASTPCVESSYAAATPYSTSPIYYAASSTIAAPYQYQTSD